MAAHVLPLHAKPTDATHAKGAPVHGSRRRSVTIQTAQHSCVAARVCVVARVTPTGITAWGVRARPPALRSTHYLDRR